MPSQGVAGSSSATYSGPGTFRSKYEFGGTEYTEYEDWSFDSNKMYSNTSTYLGFNVGACYEFTALGTYTVTYTVNTKHDNDTDGDDTDDTDNSDSET